MDSKFKVGYSRMTGCTIGNHREYDRGFRNGQQSKQAEIDKIKKLLKQWDDWISVSDGNNHIDIVKECADELRELLK